MLSQKERFLDYILCFISGFSILTLEIVLLRLVTPYAGGDIFTSSIIINGILLALAIGYWIGGKYSKLNPGMIAVIASGYLSISILTYKILGSYLMKFGNPILTTSAMLLILFFIPTILGGIITPILAERLKRLGVGRASGRIFAIGTIGSITGGIISTFLILPIFGLRGTLILATSLLFIAGIINDYANLVKKNLFIIISILTLISLFTPVVISEDCYYQYTLTCVYEKETPYGTYTVINGSIERYYYLLNGLTQSTTFYDDSGRTGSYLDAFANHNFSNSDKVLILGNSVGTAMTMIQNENPNVKITGVEIDPEITEIGKKYFQLNPSENDRIVHEDARLFLSENEEKFDYIFVDLFDNMGIPSHTITVEFNEEIKKDLENEGVFQTNMPYNIFGEDKYSKSLKKKYFNSITAVFKECSYKKQNHILTCPPNKEDDAIITFNNGETFKDEFPTDTIIQSKSFREFKKAKN